MHLGLLYSDDLDSHVDLGLDTEHKDARRLHPKIPDVEPRLPGELDVSVFAPKLGYATAKGVPTLRPASVLAHMATSPSHVRSWTSALEWLPDVVAEATADDVHAELRDRHATVTARLGYLLQGLRPDLAGQITGPSTKTWFGPRSRVIRHDSRWQVADTLLPFDPRNLEAVA